MNPRTPLGYLHGAGPKADVVVALTWALLAISVIVVLIVAGLVIAGIWRRRARTMEISGVAPSREGNGVRWLAVGVGLSSIALLGSLVWTVVVLAAISRPARPAALTIEVTGQQWWWKARYLDADPSRVFVTADEIHIPVGQPVRVKLIGADVIHSFWVPALTGKTETIPGQTNETWLQADRPGRFNGQCTEFCGAQHAHMGLVVVAEAPAKFDAWRDAQLHPAAVPESLASAVQTFVFHCGACHTVRGTDAGGTVAPDLTHLMSRSIIAGGALPNTIANLAGWIADPQAIKPGARMPTLFLSGPELQAIVGFLRTLK